MPTQLTQEQRVSALAMQMVNTTSQLYAIGQTIGQMSTLWTNLSAANKLNAFPTAALSTTGGIGTPDGSPNPANPININASPGSELTLAISANNLASLLTYLQGVQSAIGGSSVSVNGAAAQLVALCL